MYDRNRYKRDVRAAWRRSWPSIRKGLTAPIRVSVTRKWETELLNWLLLFAYMFRLIGVLVFFSLRLTFNL